MYRRSSILIVSLVCAFTLSCAKEVVTNPGDPLVERRIPDELVAEANEVVAGNNAFALDLYQNLRDQEGNLFLSPFSVSTAFAMVYGGARSQTETEIAEVFHFPLGQDRMHTLYRELLQSLDTGVGFDGYRLNVANRLWGQKGYGFLDAYLTLTREQYGAELERLDFVADPEACRESINDWVADRTEQLIPELMPVGSINGLTRLVLTNALYFKGKWETEFDPEETRTAPFHVTLDHSVDVDMMHMETEFPATWTPNAALVELPYRGQDLSMILIVPNEVDGLSDVETALTMENLSAWMGALAPTEINLNLPRFDVDSEFGLNDVLRAMGMTSAFDPTAADFSGMNGKRDLSIQAAIHKAFVKVNEEGTEAAAATGVSMGTTSVSPMVSADHPFLFLIHDNVTGSILFMGRVSDPSA